ncbi:glycogen synthase [Apibacter sp. HY039]|uniref:glycogen synthase n=1 Tax=Apibacter sp. HY039 TaxID=2501476 RepID=UPI000FEB95A5|nr:glycogen/starch synthase [Apibacter sp. HY039]
MLVIHISTECYPVIKNGGLADVIGALPKYQSKYNIDTQTVIPFVDNSFTQSEELTTVYEGSFFLEEEKISFSVYKNVSLNHDLYFIYIPSLLDRPNVYGYDDDPIRFLAFQLGVLEWLITWNRKIDILHCHDHNTGLIPFFIKHTQPYDCFKDIPVVFTVHNTFFQGIMPLEIINKLPSFDPVQTKFILWNNSINSMASGISCADKVTTVSPNYMDQLCLDSNGLEYIFQINRYKCIGLLNGIDDSIWNPETDPMICENYSLNKVEKGKTLNKKSLCKQFNLDDKKPLIAFIGKLNNAKGGDVLENLIEKVIDTGLQSNFIVMGKGGYEITRSLELLNISNKERLYFIPSLEESIVHQVFAGADFYLMPSREEPCGLGQLYSLKYGTVPIVSNKGGLEDTVKNFEDIDGYGIKFSYFSLDDILFSISKAEKIFQDKGLLHVLRKRMMKLDFSWLSQAKQYINLYKELTENKKIIWKLT